MHKLVEQRVKETGKLDREFVIANLNRLNPIPKEPLYGKWWYQRTDHICTHSWNYSPTVNGCEACWTRKLEEYKRG